MKACKSRARISHRTPRHVPTTPSTQQSWALCDMRCVFFCPTRHSRNATQTVHWSYTSCGAYCRFLLHSQLGKPNTGPNKTSCSPTEICSCIHHMSSMSHWQTSSTDLDAKNSARTSRLPAETPGRPAASETTDAHCATHFGHLRNAIAQRCNSIDPVSLLHVPTVAVAPSKNASKSHGLILANIQPCRATICNFHGHPASNSQTDHLFIYWPFLNLLCSCACAAQYISLGDFLLSQSCFSHLQALQWLAPGNAAFEHIRFFPRRATLPSCSKP